MIAEEKNTYTQEEYLAQERAAPQKSEYFEGELYPMAGATKEHNRVKENVAGEIYAALKGHRCQSFSSDFRVHIPANSLYAYPDIVVVCDDLQLLDDEFDTLLNPNVLIEVLSKGTRGYDKSRKFELYRAIPALSEYITVDSERVKVEVWQKSAEGVWMLAKETADPADSITVRTIDLTLALSDIYNRVPHDRVPDSGR